MLTYNKQISLNACGVFEAVIFSPKSLDWCSCFGIDFGNELQFYYIVHSQLSLDVECVPCFNRAFILSPF